MTKPLVVLGGGRWARVILTVLAGLDRKEPVIWVSSHGFARNREWLARQPVPRVELRSDDGGIWEPAPKAVIIATASKHHATQLQDAIGRGVPALSEKPFSFHVDEARQLVLAAKRAGVPAGVNLEFLFANYLHDFRAVLGALRLRRIDISWEDPFREERHGEAKYGDVYTPLVHDSLPHCWSVLRVLTGASDVDLRQVSYEDDSTIRLKGSIGDIQLSISLNRRGAQRLRRVKVNGTEAMLDFSREPGTTVLWGKEPVDNSWRGHRPVGASISAFLTAVETNQRQYEASLQSCLPSVVLAQEAFEHLQALLRNKLRKLEGEGRLVAEDPVVRHILVDMLVPEFDSRPRVRSDEETTRFCKQVLRDRLWTL